jgi:amino acid transporter
MEGIKASVRALLARIPTYHDLAPGRFARKMSMVAGWACLVLVPLAIAAVAGTWLAVDAQQTLYPSRGDPVNVTTTGTCSLKRCVFHRVSPDGLIDERVSGSPSSLTGVNGLDSNASGVVWLLVSAILGLPVAAVVCWVHGWARVNDQRRSYIAAASILFSVVLSLVISWILYLGAKPTAKDGYTVGWALWVDLFITGAALAILVVVLFDKPFGLLRLTKQGVIPDEPWPVGAKKTSKSSSSSSDLQESLIGSE